jgi:hypothetical protein
MRHFVSGDFDRLTRPSNFIDEYGNWPAVYAIHVVVGNRLTQFLGAAAAFSALSNATSDTLFAAYQSHPSFFTRRPQKAKSVKAFRDDYSLVLRDFNTAGVVASHLGRPLSSMPQGYYEVHGTDVKVNSSQVTECEKALDELLAVID